MGLITKRFWKGGSLRRALPQIPKSQKPKSYMCYAIIRIKEPVYASVPRLLPERASRFVYGVPCF